MIGSTTLAGSFEPPLAFGLVGVGLIMTAVAVTTAPAVGLWFPRFSTISIGQSREVVPPRLVTTALHFLGVTIPGTLLTLLLLNPQLARTLVAGITGFLPTVLLQLIAGGNSGVLSNVGIWFQDIGSAVQSIGIETFRVAAGGLLILGAIIIAVVSYRMAVRRFDRYSPPT